MNTTENTATAPKFTKNRLALAAKVLDYATDLAPIDSGWELVAKKSVEDIAAETGAAKKNRFTSAIKFYAGQMAPEPENDGQLVVFIEESEAALKAQAEDALAPFQNMTVTDTETGETTPVGPVMTLEQAKQEGVFDVTDPAPSLSMADMAKAGMFSDPAAEAAFSQLPVPLDLQD